MDFLYAGPVDAATTVMVAHGAGAAMDSPWMNRFCDLLAVRGIRSARFEFAYMASRRSGIRRAPPKAENATEEYRAAVASVDRAGGALVIGGKSYGGRVASLIAGELFADGDIAGLVCLGYPFHPPGTPDKLRTGHLARLACPTLICQGTRDPFGTIEEVPRYALSPSIVLHWLTDGDHGFRPRKASGRTEPENLNCAADAVAAFASPG